MIECNVNIATFLRPVEVIFHVRKIIQAFFYTSTHTTLNSNASSSSHMSNEM